MNVRPFVLAALAAFPLSAARAGRRAAASGLLGRALVDGGKCCATLADVRDNIDRIDRQIVALMAERGKYVAEAGRFKPDPAAISAPARVEAIIAKVKAMAREDGLAESVAELQLSRDDRRVRGFRARGVDAPQRERGRADEVRGPRRRTSARAARRPRPKADVPLARSGVI